MKKLLLIVSILLSAFTLSANAESGAFTISFGSDFHTAYSVEDKTSIGAFGLDIGMEAQLGKGSHLALILDMDINYPCMYNYNFYDFDTAGSIVIGNDFFIGLGFTTGYGKGTVFTLGAGPYIRSIDVSKLNSRYSVLSFGAEVFASAKYFVTKDWFIDASLRAGMTVYDILNASMFNWSNSGIKAVSANAFALTGRIGCGYLF